MAQQEGKTIKIRIISKPSQSSTSCLAKRLCLTWFLDNPGQDVSQQVSELKALYSEGLFRLVPDQDLAPWVKKH